MPNYKKETKKNTEGVSMKQNKYCTKDIRLTEE